jgi:stage III sporulation protein AG
METKNKTKEAILGKLLKNKYVLLILLIGLVLILLPGGKTGDPPTAEVSGLSAPEFSLAEEERRLGAALADIDGVGQVSVLLSLKSTSKRILAASGGEALVVNQGSGTQSAVELSFVYPEYLGAAVVCSGADSASVRLTVVGAVQSFTGLPSNKISVIKMK